jgi:hypothetical protein
VSVEFGRRLLLSGAVGQSEIQAALFRHLGTGTPFIRALIEIGGVSERAIEEELMRSPAPVLDVVVPLPSLVDELPDGLCRRLYAVPVRRDERTGLVDVAVVDPYDAHAADEIAFHLRCQVRILRAKLSAVEEALSRIDQGVYSDKVIVRKSEPPAPARSPSGPPIPLVRRSSRAGEGFVGGRSVTTDDDEAIEVLGVRDIVEEMDGGVATDDLGQPVMPLTASKVPRAPGVPTFSKEPHEKKGDTIPPATSKGPFSPKAPLPPFADIDGVLAAIDKARTRDEVIENLIAGMSTVARRVGAFAVKKRGFCGIACNSDLGEAQGFREIEIPTDAPTVLGIATSKGSYLGPLPATPPHESLLRFMRGTSGEVAAVLVSVAGRPAVVLFADALGDTMIATRRAEQLGKEASRAFSRILTEAKSERRGNA